MALATARDDGWVRTHDDAFALLDYAVPGARVFIDDVPRSRSRDILARSRSYTVVLDAAEGHVQHATKIYTLPIKAADLARSAREAADEARRWLSDHAPSISTKEFSFA